MSAPDKLRGQSANQPASELTRFKLLWRDSLAEPARDYWRALFISETKQADIRAQIATKLKIKLTFDKQLNAFRKWIAEQSTRDEEAARMADDEKRLAAQFGDAMSKDQIRELVLKASYARTMATGDFKLGLRTANVDLKEKSLAFDQEKFKESLRSKLESGLAELAQHIKGSAKAKEAYEAFKATVSETTK